MKEKSNLIKKIKNPEDQLLIDEIEEDVLEYRKDFKLQKFDF